MIDPFTAFALAQGAVKGIKAALQLGKDVNGLYREFSAFYQSADAVHVASSKMRMDSIGKTDAQLSDQALQIAFASKALRDYEKELKDMLFWSGNAPVWHQMQAERLRLMKQRTASELIISKARIKRKEDIATLGITVMCFIGSMAVIAPIAMIALKILMPR
jgi:hypothetical protein